MCGLAGILLYPMERPEAEWEAIRDCFTQMLLANEERGREASGVAVIQGDGTFQMYKGPLPASRLSETEAYRQVLAIVGPETTCLLGHTRAPTKGSCWNNANNHPLVAGRVIGIHNGHIHNDDELFADIGLPREGQVDSEIIFRLLDTIPLHSQNGTYLQEVRRRANMLQGCYATLSVNLEQPDRLLVLKKDMPLCVHYHESWQALFFSSRYLFLRKVFGRPVIAEALDSGRVYLFDARRLAELGKRAVGSLELATDRTETGG